MFTGIVEEKGLIEAIEQESTSLVLSIKAQLIMSDVKIGDSIAVNGVCLTVTDFTDNGFTVDVMPETFRATSLKQLEVGKHVNLERAMAANARFGGHFVSGHVDRVGYIKDMWEEANAKYMLISFETEDGRYFIDKGSVTVDGTSLTVFDRKEDAFMISLIPETQSATILGGKEVGDPVNLEFDLLAKYIERLITHDASGDDVTKEKLDQFGFLK
ncbi:riboflavin synthase alpha chain [Pelagirhabdus alkalitolerans]|uniref:Riboflavin synthase n=1 Tax=Pelagirhabdus alkalitolerans TaxID=1612202 RepID=A0A1G6JIP4_9BACI|nr:riboflavin synthase [Pelagirhabdus alkalitolerans]SDC18604.1 riboflavin synthase alpha chain [Pelagirhabdus alkalitolerans]